MGFPQIGHRSQGLREVLPRNVHTIRMTNAPREDLSKGHDDAEVVLARLLPTLPQFGVSRLANITGLDRVGLPVWQAIRPNSRALSVAQGKGESPAAAKVSAILEALEGHHAEHSRCSIRIESHRALSREAVVAEPTGLPLARGGSFDEDRALPWVRAVDVVTEESVWVPFELVHANFTVPRLPGSGAFVPSTNGLGAGVRREQAISHGVCELIERDAETLARLGQDASARRQLRRVDPKSVEVPRARALIELFERAGLVVMIWDITSDIQVPCFSVVIFDLQSDPDLNPSPAAEGSGCHPNAEVALCRALAEAAQSRLTAIAGSRDDFTMQRYDAFQSQESLAAWRARASQPVTRRFSETRGEESAVAALDVLCDRLRARGIRRVLAVDLTHDDGPLEGFTFMRSLVVGLEGSLHSPSYSPGPRARGRLEESRGASR